MEGGHSEPGVTVILSTPSCMEEEFQGVAINFVLRKFVHTGQCSSLLLQRSVNLRQVLQKIYCWFLSFSLADEDLSPGQMESLAKKRKYGKPTLDQCSVKGVRKSDIPVRVFK